MKKDMMPIGWIRFLPLFFLTWLVWGCENHDVASDQPQEKNNNVASEGESPDQESLVEQVLREVKENPNDASVLFHLADLYDRHGQYEKAIETYAKVVALQPDHGYAYFKMGTAYHLLNQPGKAVEAYLKAAEFLPKLATVFNNLGIEYGKLGKIDDEITALQKAIQLRPNYAAARYSLAIVYLRKGDSAAAMLEYEKLKDFDSSLAEKLKSKISEEGKK